VAFLSDKATNQIPRNLPAVIFVLGTTALRVGEKLCSFSPTDTKLILLSEVMKTPERWHEGCEHHSAVAPNMGSHSPLVLLICRRSRQNCQTPRWSHRKSSNISIHNPKIVFRAYL
jgi:hypothetical protein